MTVFLMISVGTVSTPATQPLVCNLQAMSAAELDRHRALGAKLRDALVSTRELKDGYELTLDLSRLAPDAKGQPFCVVEVAEWVDQESRCCPFLEFGIDVRGGSPITKLRLSGPEDAKAFLKEQLPIAHAAAP
jgi:hypothetical protein